MRLLFASQNPGKIREVFSIINHPSIELFSLSDIDQEFTEPEETGGTFEANALLKAEYYAKKAGMSTLADDSGISVSAMDGGPGVNSNRWQPGTEADRNQALLNFLKDKDDRRAEFITVACYYDYQDGSHKCFQGKIAGTIALEPSGTDGFGYDPIFIPDGYEQTFAALGNEIKDQLSHRAKAYREFMKYLLEIVA